MTTLDDISRFEDNFHSGLHLDEITHFRDIPVFVLYFQHCASKEGAFLPSQRFRRSTIRRGHSALFLIANEWIDRLLVIF